MNDESCVRRCSSVVLALTDLLVAAAHKAEHGEEWGNPERECHVEIIRHCPDVCRVPDGGFSHRSRADSIVLGEHEATRSDKHRELEQADNTGEVDRADSPSVSPGANEHSKSVQAGKEVDEAQKTSDKSQLRALSLAINIAVLESIEPCFAEVTVHIDVVPLVIVGDGESLIWSLPCADFLVLLWDGSVYCSNVGTL